MWERRCGEVVDSIGGHADDRCMFDDMTAYFKAGDQVKAFVLDFDTK